MWALIVLIGFDEPLQRCVSNLQSEPFWIKALRATGRGIALCRVSQPASQELDYKIRRRIQRLTQLGCERWMAGGRNFIAHLGSVLKLLIIGAFVTDVHVVWTTFW